MPGVHATPEKLRAFAGQMQSYLKKLETETNSLQAAFRELKADWRDAQGYSFERTLQDLANAQSAFRENANKQIPLLHQMAEDLERYLRR